MPHLLGQADFSPRSVDLSPGLPEALAEPHAGPVRRQVYRSILHGESATAHCQLVLHALAPALWPALAAGWPCLAHGMSTRRSPRARATALPRARSPRD